jgi:IS6 family transposase
LISHTTIMRWVFKFSFELEHRVKPHLKKVSDSWRVDEAYVKVKGKWVVFAPEPENLLPPNSL